MSRAAVAVLSTENLLHNFKVIKKKAHPSKVIAVVKANAYGHGIRSVSLKLDPYTDIIGVSSIDEALILRKVGVKKPILLMQGIFEPSELLIASAEKFHVVFHNIKQIEWLERSRAATPIDSWVKFNTGMGRLGFATEEVKSIYSRLLGNHKVSKPIRIMSHFSCSDEPNHPMNQKQIRDFNHVIAGIKTEYSLCNSSAIFNFPSCHYDYVRPGLAIYGISPTKNCIGSDFGLKPVMSLQTNITSIQHFKKGETIGYGAKYKCPKDMFVGIIAFGYGDGYPFVAKSGTPVLVNSVECPIVGQISMDMMTVDLTNLKQQAKIGDPVVLWGDRLPIEKVAESVEAITWSMLTGVQSRVRFLWTHTEGVPDFVQNNDSQSMFTQMVKK